MSTSYSNPGGSGERRHLIGVATSGSGFIGQFVNLVNGNNSSAQGYYWGGASSGASVTFDFGAGGAVVDEAKWYQQSGASHGTWKWQGSNDGSSWDDIGSSFELGSSATQTLTELAGNTTSYRYYRILGVSGSRNDGPWLYEIEFKLEPTGWATGDRTGSITVTASENLVVGGPVSGLVNGSISSIGWSGQPASGHWIQFDFGLSIVLDGARWIQDAANTHGTMQWQGSANGSDWTNIGSQFTFPGDITQVNSYYQGVSLTGNSTAYRYYRVLGISGSFHSGPSWLEMEFRIGTGSTDIAGSTGGAVEVAGGSGGTVEWDPPIDLTGTAGGTINVTGGAIGGVGNPFVGLTGGLISIAGGVGSVFTLISGTSGGLLEIAAGSGGALFSQISGTAGGTISVSGGTTGLIYNRTEQAFLVWIRGTEVSRFVKDPSVSVTAQLAGRASAQFVVIPNRGESFVPAVRDEVIVLHQASGFRLFAGMVESVSDDLWPGTRGHREYTVKCTDYGVICERRAIAKWYTIAMGSYAPIVAYDIHASFLEGTGITYEHGGQPAGAYFGEIFFNWISVAQALDQICQAGGLEWRIDYYKALKLISRSEGYEAAPFSIGQDDGNWRRLVATTSRGKFANRVIVRNSQDIAAVWTDEITLNGAAIYPTTYPLEVKPVVTLDDVEQIVCEMSQRGSTAGWQWYYIAGGTGIFPNPASVPGSGTLRVMYPSKVSFVAIAEDEESIAAVGRHEHIEEVKDLQSVEAMQAHADSVLAQRSAIATTLEIETDRAGLEPGQLVTVSANDIAGDFLIEQTDCQEIAHSYPRWKVRASDASLKLGSGTAYLARILARQRQALDRIDSHIAFVLAETIPGITNPGLSTGLKNAVRVARKNGYLKQVRLYFLSVASTLTTSDIEIDILRDGTSIFPSGQYMRFPAGAEAVQTQFWFAMNPYQVFAGDVFTINVISADAAAMDGWLEIQVQG